MLSGNFTFRDLPHRGFMSIKCSLKTARVLEGHLCRYVISLNTMTEVSSVTCNLKLEFGVTGKKNNLDTVMIYKNDHSLKIT